MEALNNINIQSLLDSFISLSTAFILGSAIGLERQYRQRTAGLRTNVLVAEASIIKQDQTSLLMKYQSPIKLFANRKCKSNQKCPHYI
jgi:putative Mg2+ transporter-C (MgtC) family protein